MTGPVHLELADGVAHLVLDAPGRSANLMDDDYGAAMEAVVDHLVNLVGDGGVRGVLLRSAKRTFFAGGDLDAMIARPRTHEAWRWRLEQVQRPLQALAGLPVPVVAAVNGAAVGGGLEIALAAHARVALAGSYPLGLPEVRLGVLAAGGGVSRTVRLLGLQRGLEQVLLPGATVDPAAAQQLGLVDAVVTEDLVGAALAMLDTIPVRPAVAADRSWLPAVRARVEHGVPDAPRALLRAALAGAGLPADGAGQHEVTAFLDLVTGPQFGLTLRAAYGDRQTVLRSVPREPAVVPAPVTEHFEVRTAGCVVQAALVGPDLRRGVVELVVAAGTSPGDVEEARRTVRSWGGCPVVARRTSYVGALRVALHQEIGAVRRDGVAQDVLDSALLRLGLGAPDAEPVLVADVADRLAGAVSLTALTALADGTIGSVAEANLASVAGTGFPEALGGAVGHALHHVEDGTITGVAGFVRTADRLAREHGGRFVIRRDVLALARTLADQEETP